MSLFQQIQTLIVAILLIVLGVVFKIDFQNAQEFAENQMYNNARNVANVLALTLGANPSDQVFVETSINAMFDGGYFEEIDFFQADKTVVYQKREKLVVENVPTWFISLVGLEVPVAEAAVMNGWVVFGKLRVKGHGGPFYIKLWDTFKQLGLLFLLLSGAALVISHLILIILLRSLNRLQQQAYAISNNQFEINQDVPRTPELKNVVIAMNTMSEKVKNIYQRQLESIQRYQEMEFKDPATELYNRKYLIQRLSHFLDSDSQRSQGQIVIFGLMGMDTIRISMGHPVILGFYEQMGHMLSESIQDISEGVVAKLSNHEFAVLLPGCDMEEGRQIAQSAIGGLMHLISLLAELAGRVTIVAGQGSFGYKDNIGSVLSKADYALSVASGKPSGTVEAFQEEEDVAVMGKFEWKTMIEEALEENRFTLTAQPVMSATTELHKEVYVNLIDQNGRQHRAGYFMPMVISLGLSSRLDQHVLQCAARHIDKNPDSKVAVNITDEFCRDRLALLWLRKFLRKNIDKQSNLIFELHDQTLVQYTDVCMDIAEMLMGIGFTFGLDQYSMNNTSLHLLKDIRPRYIKIEQTYLLDKENVVAQEVALNALGTIADSLDIHLIATKIENQEQLAALKRKQIQYFQGLAITKITPLENGCA